VTGFAPWQEPPWQVSVWVHALPSLHVVPFDFGCATHEPLGLWQTPVLH
jgi:hypothetical protein